MVTYRLTDEDIISGNRLWWRYRIKPYAYIAAFLLIWIGMCLFSGLTGRETLVVAIVTNFFVSLCAILGMHYVLPRISTWQSLRYFRQASNSALDTSADWDKMHIAFSQTDAFQKLPWRDIKGWRENDDVIVLMRIGPMFNPIPKRAMNAQQLENLRSCMTEAGIS
ncbi:MULTISPECIES: YcxB family protein [Rhizobium]|uniref:YcxB family protein n=1 Tax=Rhizobium tumorigenes TaxID=2041385 RepID=A0AAF1KU67_9HYPH|nr:YcxB family protein [Rhizobium tumorigenes]WFR98095.1 YcxB family protein [Rhizobium tumorigenes]